MSKTFTTLFSIYLIAFSGFALASENNRTSITSTTVKTKPLNITQKVVGSLESLNTPTISAENSGRILELAVDIGQKVEKGQVIARLDNKLAQIALQSSQYEIKRLKALIANQELTVKRFTQLVKQKSQSQSYLDEAATQLKALKAQLNQASRAADEARYHLEKTTITAPIAGFIQERLISVGDFVNLGTPIVKMVTTDNLRARFSLPETMRDQLFPGQKITISTPALTNNTVSSQIQEIKPMLDAGNRSVEVIVDFKNPGRFQPGASVDGVITLDHKDQALMVPELALVSRPKGQVIYEIKNNQAVERLVKIGHRKNGEVEVLAGIQPNTKIAVEGAGFLDQGSQIKLQG